MKKIFLFLTLSMFISLYCNAQEDLDKKYATDLLKYGEQAPDFIISNGDSLAGKQLSSLKGKFVVLDFWASWCPGCRKDIPEMKELHRRYSSDMVAFVSVSFDTNKEVWQKCVRNNGMSWIHHSELKPWKQTGISKDYHIKWLPTMYLLDTKGKVIFGTVDIMKLKYALEVLDSASYKMMTSHANSAVYARYPKGWKGVVNFISNSLQYPELAKSIKAEGEVLMHFTINPDGSITDITATECKINSYDKASLEKYPAKQQKDIYNECIRLFAKEGYRVIKSMKKWLPDHDNNAKHIQIQQKIMFSFF